MIIKNILNTQYRRMVQNYKYQMCENVFNNKQCQTIQDLIKLSQNIKLDQLVKMITFPQKQYIFWQLKEKWYQNTTNINDISTIVQILYKFSREDFLTCLILISDQEFLNFLLVKMMYYIQLWEQDGNELQADISAKILLILNNVCIDFNDEYIHFQEMYLEQHMECIKATYTIIKKYLQTNSQLKRSQEIETLLSQYLKFIRLTVQNIKDPRLIEYVVDLMLALPVGENQFENLLRHIGSQVNDSHLILLEQQLNIISSQYQTGSIQCFLNACIDNDQISQSVLQNQINKYILIKMNKQRNHIITVEELKLVNWIIDQRCEIKEDIVYQLVQQIIYTVRPDNYQLYKETLFNVLNTLQLAGNQFLINFILYNLYQVYKTSLLLEEAVKRFAIQGV